MTAREVCLIIIVALIAPSCGRNEGPRLPAIGKAFVGAKTLKIRREIGFHSDAIAEARFGEKLDVVQRRRFNLQVRTVDGVTGWVDGRALIGAREVEGLKKLAVDHKQTAPMAAARAGDVLRIHTTPNRESPGFDVAQENERVEVLGHRLALRAPYNPPALPEPPGRKKKRKDKADEDAFSLPPPPAPPKPPEDWQGLNTKAGEAEEEKKKKRPRSVKNALLLKAEEGSRQKGPVYDDWSLVRLKSGSVGWALSSALVMDLPEGLAASGGPVPRDVVLPGGRSDRRRSGPQAALVFHDDQQAGAGAPIRWHGAGLLQQRRATNTCGSSSSGRGGLLSGGSERAQRKPVVAVILENADGTCARRRFVLEGNRLKLLDQLEVPRPRTPQTLDDLPAMAIPEPAEDEERTWWGQVMKNLFGK